MSKIKVSELAKEVNIKSKELVDFLHEKGYSNVKNMNSILGEEEEKTVRLKFAPDTIKKDKPVQKPQVKQKKPRVVEKKVPMKQSFDGRSKEVRDAVEKKSKQNMAENRDNSNSEERVVSETIEEKVQAPKKELTPEERAIAFAREKASQAAAINDEKKKKNIQKNQRTQQNKNKKRDTNSKNEKSDSKRVNSQKTQDQRPKSNDTKKQDDRQQKNFKRTQSQPRTVQVTEERIVTKTSGRNREKEKERDRAKERNRTESGYAKRFDKNKVLSTLDEDDNLPHRKKQNKKGAFIKPEVVKKPEEEDGIKKIIIPQTLTIKELADKMKVQPSAIIKKLFMQGKMYTVTQDISFEEAALIAIDYNIECELEEQIDLVAELLKEADEDETLMEKRPPVVCVMGHVDHGKTSLLDAIRSTNVTSKEAGGITQSIGASVVTIDNDKKITFLDTPGHEAFTAMRMRGAKSTDIAILVVAADDGVMPQTVEAINHAKAAGVEVIVAINKIDKPSANIDRVKQELSEYELIPEDWGGSTIFVPVSAHTKEGIDQLLEMVLLTADVAEYRANPNRDARGIVIEASLDKGRGPVATVLVQKGTLKVGDSISIGSSFGKVRAMIDDKGKNVTKATPSIPVEILGLNGVPNSGDTMLSFKDDKEARAAAETFIAQDKARLIDESRKKLSLDGLFDQIKAGNVKELKVIIKADVQGSVEAIKQSLIKLNNEEVAIRVIHGAVGSINESDISLASASNAIVIGFNVRIDAVAKETADREKVDVRLYNIIYNIISDVEMAMKGMLEPIYEESIIGHAEIRQIFKASGIGNIAGSYVLDGKIIRGCKARVIRDKDVIFDGNLASLKRFKDDVKEVKAGYECGLVFEKFNDVKEGDTVELYQMVEVPRS